MKGYTIDKRNSLKPYIAQINIDGNTVRLGSFATPEEATARYLEERAKYPRKTYAGGNPGYQHPKHKCKICGDYVAANHTTRHFNWCYKKLKEDFPDVEFENIQPEPVPRTSVPNGKKRYTPRSASSKFLSRTRR
jgi:hypothetical protein